MFYVYILYSENFDRYYIGSSKDPWLRIEYHNLWRNSSYTSKFRPWRLVAVFEGGCSRSQAYKMEQFIKRQKSRALIEQLIKPDFKAQAGYSHTLRHLFATQLLEQGVDIRYIQELLGHSRPETTMIYTHVRRQDLLKIRSPLDLLYGTKNLSDKQPVFPNLSPD